jgi:hypothetical protein
MIIPKASFQRLLAYDPVLADHVSETMEERRRANVAVRTS